MKLLSAITLTTLIYLSFPVRLSAQDANQTPPPTHAEEITNPIHGLFILLTNSFCEPSAISSKLTELPPEKGKELLVKKVRKLLECKGRMDRLGLDHDIHVPKYELVKDLRRHPYSFFKLMPLILGDTAIGDDLKRFLAQLSSCLRLEDYLALSYQALQLFDEGNASPELLYTFIFPGDGWYHQFGFNYKEPKVRNFLAKVKAVEAVKANVDVTEVTEDTDGIVDIVDQILSGKVKQRYDWNFGPGYMSCEAYEP